MSGPLKLDGQVGLATLDATRPQIPGGADSPEALAEAAEQFESIFIQRMMKSMRDTVPDGEGLFKRSHAEKTFQQMLDQRHAEQMAGAGGIGLAEVVMSQWIRRPSLRGTHFTPPVDAELSSGFGLRADPFEPGSERHHDGADFPVPEGSDVRAAAPGTVTFVGERGGFGQTVVISHGRGVESLYAHNSDITVEVGQRVERGAVISHAGQTGRATGAHLHFEIRRDGEAIDPARFLNESAR